MQLLDQLLDEFNDADTRNNSLVLSQLAGVPYRHLATLTAGDVI